MDVGRKVSHRVISCSRLFRHDSDSVAVVVDCHIRLNTRVIVSVFKEFEKLPRLAYYFMGAIVVLPISSFHSTYQVET